MQSLPADADDRVGARPGRCAVLALGRDPLVLQGVRRVLEGTSDFYVVAQSTDLRDTFEDLPGLVPDLVLMDLRREETSAGPELCRRSRVLMPGVDLVIRAVPDDPAPLAACLRAGAAGILSSGSGESDLVTGLRRIRAREVVVDGEIHRALHGLGRDGDRYERLRPREQEVLALLAEGRGTREIAEALGLSRNTVRSYAQAVMSKLQVHNRVQLVVAARQLNLG